MTQEGHFWCDECQAHYPIAVEAPHLAKHAEAESYEYDEMSGPKIGAFWCYCIAVGAVMALVVNTLL
jgi:hypothetical protein